MHSRKFNFVFFIKILFILTASFAFPFCSCKRESRAANTQATITPPPTPAPATTTEEPPQVEGDNFVLTITFDGSAAGIASTIPLLKYNKKKCVALQFDDANESSLAVLDKFESLFYTDGCGNNIPYSADLAINGKHGSDNRELGASPGSGVQYKEMLMLIAKNWDIQNHGFYHNDGTIPREDKFTNGKNASKNLKDLDDLVLDRLKYKMNCLVVPTNFGGYMLSGKTQGYIGGTSSNTFDAMTEPELWDGWRHPKRLSAYKGLPFTAIQREFAENQWVPTDYIWTGLQSTIKETEPSMQAFGTHGMNPAEEASFRKWMDAVASMKDDVMMTSMREFLEYEHLRWNIEKKDAVNTNQLQITIDYSKIPNKNISWKDLSFILSGTAPIKEVTCNNPSFKLTYNAATRLISVKKRKTEW